MSSRPRRLFAVGAVLTAAALAISACGGSSSGSEQSSSTGSSTGAASSSSAGSTTGGSVGSSDAQAAVTFNLTPEQNRVTTPKVDAIAALVPQEIRDRGTLRVTATVGTAPPLAFYADDDTTIIGSEPDFAYLFADVLGLDVEYSAADWAQNFVRIDSGEADAFILNVTVTEERKEKYDFATYRNDNLAFEVLRDSGISIAEPKDVAGLKIGVGSGTNQEKILVDWSDANVAAGLEPTDIQYYQNASDYYLALGSGRIDAFFGPNPTAQYHAASTGETEVTGVFSGAGDTLQGEIATLTLKGNGLAEALQAAINETIENGTYEQVLERWNLTSEAVDRSELNPPGLPRTAS